MVSHKQVDGMEMKAGEGKHNQRVAIDLLNRKTVVFQDKTATINLSDLNSIYRWPSDTNHQDYYCFRGHPYEPSHFSVAEWVV